MSLLAVIAVASGGFCGAVLRAAIGRHVHSKRFPTATLLVNVTGSGLFAFIATLPNLSPSTRLALLTGLCGAFTTFSTFILESLILLRSHMLRRAAAYIFLTIVGSLAASACGHLTAAFLF